MRRVPLMLVEALSVLALVVPAGFREAPALEPAASWVAGKPVQVWCGVTRLGDVYEGGYTDRVGGSNIFLTPSLVCDPLEKKLARQTVTSTSFGRALQTLVHESEHAKGVGDESQAECSSLAAEAA